MELEIENLKKTEFGVIPFDWELFQIQDLIDTSFIVGHLDGNHGALYPRSEEFTDFGIPYISANDFYAGKVEFSNCKHLTFERGKLFRKGIAKNGDVLFAHNATVGPVALLKTNHDFVILSTTATYFRCNKSKLLNTYLLYALQSSMFVKQYTSIMSQSTRFQVPITAQRKLVLFIPPLSEQTAIATALSDADALIRSLEQLIEKKKKIKQGAMQELLTGRRRLTGFKGNWKIKQLIDLADCLDNLRIPLNESERNLMRGDYPYCGANGILDYIDRFSIDDDIILIAEDGGYFDEYSYRPIAYRMKGKCWINNHAHILKAKTKISQLFLFYSLVHKNILSYLASGTRAKLNKSEMFKIQIYLPDEFDEQDEIGKVLEAMDEDLIQLESKKEKLVGLKEGMMQNLLTGKIRLI